MTWIAPISGSSWERRIALSVIGKGNTEALVDLSGAGDYFWLADNLLVSGYDLRVTSADGITLLPFQRNAYNVGTKTGTLDITGITTLNGETTVLWLYFSQASAADASSVITPGVQDSAHPEPGYGPDFNIVVVSPEQVGATRPRKKIQKGAAEEVFVWWRLGRVLARSGRRTQENLMGLWEEISTAVLVVTTGGVTQVSMVDTTTALIQSADVVRTTLKAGTTGDDYTLSQTVPTSEGRTFNPRAFATVKDVDET